MKEFSWSSPGHPVPLPSMSSSMQCRYVSCHTYLHMCMNLNVLAELISFLFLCYSYLSCDNHVNMVSLLFYSACLNKCMFFLQVDNHLPFSASPTILYPYPMSPSIASSHGMCFTSATVVCVCTCVLSVNEN